MDALHFLEQHLAAGGLAHSRELDLTEAIAISIATFLIADFAWYNEYRRSTTDREHRSFPHRSRAS